MTNCSMASSDADPLSSFATAPSPSSRGQALRGGANLRGGGGGGRLAEALDEICDGRCSQLSVAFLGVA